MRYVVSAVSLIFVLVIVALSLLISSNSSDVYNNETFTPCVIIDAGHGGEDGGTSSEKGVLEKDINLSVSKYLAQILECFGYNTIMTRESDEQIGDITLPSIRQRKISDIRARLSLTQSYPDALFVSIHQNHYSSAKYWGAQVFYSPNSNFSKQLADAVQGSLVNMLQHDNKRMTKEVGSNIYLLYNCKNTAIMVECGFLSNTEEAERLNNIDYQQQLAFSVACGIINYLEDRDG